MAISVFSVGRDTQLVVIGPSGRIDLAHVTGFDSRQVTQSVRVNRLDGNQMGMELPKGWEGSFELERGDSTVEDFIAYYRAKLLQRHDQYYQLNVPIRVGSGWVHIDLPVQFCCVSSVKRRPMAG